MLWQFIISPLAVHVCAGYPLFCRKNIYSETKDLSRGTYICIAFFKLVLTVID